MKITVIQDFLAFLKDPKRAETYSEMPSKSFFTLLIVTLVLIIPFGFLLSLLGADQFDSILEELIKKSKLLVIVLGIFLAPLIEEPIFRLHLNLKKSSIWWSLVLSLLMMGELWYLVLAFMVYLIYLLIMVSQQERINLKFVVYASAIFFGVVHLGNYSNFDFASHFYWIPFLVGIQFFVGLILSYIRLNHGISYAMLFHGAYNAALIIPGVYFYEG
ncbi:CPBP family glutamic-type intramembrane protease [Algoriphagus chordae]|uniref:CAAX prenyl protease-like protein n=1 Tax=Algoriphagus chordae TaxID=237019 RepID=A0A2W7RDJ6_9BACT|nr:CPBP family glutamic-type intramembrane protease [Algoriphagus chordae]PZX58201.1 CAAX prenyl protease-like protein [Algoriphagus chordae]